MTLALTGAGKTSGVAPFDPSTITGLDGWWKADAITGKNDGDAISAWTASVGNDLAQATGSKQPLYKTGIQNGKPAVLFDGVDDFLNATITSRATTTVFVVARLTSTSGDRQFSYTVGGQEMFDITVGGFGLGLYQGASFVGTAYTAPLAWTVLTGVFAGTASTQFRRDGSVIATGNAGSSSSGTTFYAGSNAGSSRFLGGYIGEILRYNGVLSGTDLGLVEAGMKAKWGTP